MDSLPSEILSKIFYYSDSEDLLLSLRFTCNRWKETVQELRNVNLRISWFEKFSRRSVGQLSNEEKQKWLRELLTDILPLMGESVKSIHFDNIPPKDAFILLCGFNSGETSPWIITEEIVDLIYRYLPNVRELDFGMAAVSPVIYPKLAAFKELRALAIHDVDATFEPILNCLINLRRLTISGKDAPLNWPGSVNIRELCLRQPTPQAYLGFIGQELDFQELVEKFPHLRVHLDARTGLSIISPITRHGLSPAYRRLTSLSNSTMANYFFTFTPNWTPIDANAFANLRKLTIKATTVNPDQIINLPSLPRLEDLRIWFRRDCKFYELPALFSIKTLRRLQLRDFNTAVLRAEDDISPLSCQRLETLHIWAVSDDKLRIETDILVAAIQTAERLRSLQLHFGAIHSPSHEPSVNNLAKFTNAICDKLKESGHIQRLQCLEMPFVRGRRPPNTHGRIMPAKMDATYFSNGANQMQKLALDVDSCSPFKILPSKHAKWSVTFPQLISMTIRLRLNPEFVHRKLAERLLWECKKLEELFIDHPTKISMSMMKVLGSHLRIKQVTIIGAQVEQNCDFEELMRILAEKRLDQLMKKGYRLSTLTLNLKDFHCNAETLALLASAGVILK